MSKEEFKPVFEDIQRRDYSWMCKNDNQVIGFQIDGRLPKYFKRENSEEYIDDIVMSQIF